MSEEIEKLKYDNDQLLMQLGWLLERVVVKDGSIELPCYQLSSRDVLNSMTELKKIVNNEKVSETD